MDGAAAGLLTYRRAYDIATRPAVFMLAWIERRNPDCADLVIGRQLINQGCG